MPGESGTSRGLAGSTPVEVTRSVLMRQYCVALDKSHTALTGDSETVAPNSVGTCRANRERVSRASFSGYLGCMFSGMGYAAEKPLFEPMG